jgi:glycosyltransferase involved in cell wall biosynthesis
MISMIHVLHIHDKAESAGGIRKHVEQAVEVQRRAGIDASAQRIMPQRAQSADREALPRTYWPSDNWRHSASIIAAVKALQPDILHLHAGFTSLSPKVLSLLASNWPVVATFHDVAPFCSRGDRRFAGGDTLCQAAAGSECVRSGCIDNGAYLPRLVPRLNEWMRKSLLSRWLAFEHLIFPSEYLQSLAILNRADAEKCSTISNFVLQTDTNKSKPSDVPRILFAGSLTVSKGADLALEALVLARDVPWTACFAGQGPLFETLKQRATAAGLSDRIIFLGVLSSDELARQRQSSDFSIFASRTAESFAMVGIESLACGKPVAGFVHSGASEWLIDGITSIAASQASAASLSLAIRRLALDAPLRIRLGAMGRELVQRRFLPDKYIGKISAVYESAIANFPTCAEAAE